jgi:LuxR family maltose regulon positive regulatory protein
VVETSLFGWEAAARLAWRGDDPPGALHILDEAEASMGARHGERARRLVRLARAKLILQTPGDLAAASLGVELAAIGGDAVSVGLGRAFTQTARLTLARHEARCGDPRWAISLVQPIQASAQRAGRIPAWAEASLIHAGALARLEDGVRAMRYAWPAIGQLASSGHVSMIADEAVMLAPLLEELIAHAAKAGGRDDPAIAAVVQRLAARGGRLAWMIIDSAQPPAPADPAVPLTSMERRVLGLAAEGLSNAQIAARTLTRLTTIKWHMRNIFQKLDVRSRTAALAQARRAGLDL